MSVLDEIRPTEKHLVMDLLHRARFDVSHWPNYKGRSPAANPKYCYNWSFEQPGETVAVCLWHRELEPHKGTVVFRRKPRDPTRKKSEASVRNRRSAEFGRNLEIAYRQQLPVRAIIIEGKQRNPADANPKASIVKARLLDEAPWAVTDYDYTTGACVLVRGAAPVTPATPDSSDFELSWFEGKRRPRFIVHRRREAAARRAKIAQALEANGGRLICEVPNCGFDFAKQYGALGKGYAQVHHRLPLGKASHDGQKTKLEDLAIVCANCHAMIHVGGECRSLAGLIRL
jgi:hypothetical protein